MEFCLLMDGSESGRYEKEGNKTAMVNTIMSCTVVPPVLVLVIVNGLKDAPTFTRIKGIVVSCFVKINTWSV